MRLRKITADNMQEALARIKVELGADAVILGVKNTYSPGFFGLFRKSRVEVTAAVDMDIAERSSSGRKRTNAQGSSGSRTASTKGERVAASSAARRAYASSAPTDETDSDNTLPDDRSLSLESPRITASVDRSTPDARGEREGSDGTSRRPAQSGKRADGEGLDGLRQELVDLKEAIVHLVNRSSDGTQEGVFKGAVLEAFRKLVGNDVEEETARILLEEVADELKRKELDDPSAVQTRLVEKVTNLLPLSGQIRVGKGSPNVVVLVGPTGVGKTTTIAKLAAVYALSRKKKVGLITADTYRIAAIEQLKTYSDIIGVPIDVVYTPEEMTEALKCHQDKDLVLIDTAGRNPRNSARILELRGFIKAAQPDEVHLVMSATTKNRDAVDIVERFEQVGFDRILFTKLDEGSTHGVILNVLVRAQRPLSYIGTGQNVPEDFEVADGSRLAMMITGGFSGTEFADGHEDEDALDDGDDPAGAASNSGLSSREVVK